MGMRVTFSSLMQEARAMLPTLDPAWTDHNPSDPGMIVMELLAWMHETLLYRLEDIPEESIRAQLSLLSGQEESAAVPLAERLPQVLMGLKRLRRLVTTEDYRAELLRAAPSLLEDLGAGLADVTLLPQRNIESQTPTAPAPGHLSVVLSAQRRALGLSLELPPAGLLLSFDHSGGEPLCIQLEQCVRQALSLTLTSPRGVPVLRAALPATVPVLEASGSGVGLRSGEVQRQAGGAVTLELTLKLTTLGSASSLLFCLGDPSSQDALVLRGPDAQGWVELRYGSSTASGPRVDLRPYLGEWIQLACTASSSVRSILINGVERARQETQALPSSRLLQGLVLAEQVACQLSEVRLWKTCLSSDALMSLRGLRLDGTDQALSACWPLIPQSDGSAPELVQGGSALALGSAGRWVEGDPPVHAPLCYLPTVRDPLNGRRWTLELEGEEALRGVLTLRGGGRVTREPFCLPAPALLGQALRRRPNERAVLRLRGTDQVSLSSVSNALLLSDLTLELWFRPEILGAMSLLSTARAGELDLSLTAEGRVQFTYGDRGTDEIGQAQRVLSDRAVQAGRWQHLAVVRRSCAGGAWVQLSLDGLWAGGGFRPVPRAGMSSRPLILGAGWAGGLQGDLAELRIWSCARSSAALEHERYALSAQDLPGLLGCWRFQQGAGDQLVDESRTGCRGLLSGGEWRVLRQSDGGSPPPLIPCVAQAPAFGGGVVLLDTVPAGVLQLQGGLSERSGAVGAALVAPDGQVCAAAEPSRALLLIHTQRPADALSQGWRLRLQPLASSRSHLEGTLSAQPELSDAMLARIRAELLEPRRMLTVRHHVCNPVPVLFEVRACLFLLEGFRPADVKSRAQQALLERFRPRSAQDDLYGGWIVGQGVYLSDIIQVLEHVEGVDFVVGGPWPTEGLPSSPSETLRLLPQDEPERFTQVEGLRSGFRVAPHEWASLNRISLTTALKRGDVWHPTE